jgi:hypothetical protein
VIATVAVIGGAIGVRFMIDELRRINQSHDARIFASGSEDQIANLLDGGADLNKPLDGSYDSLWTDYPFFLITERSDRVKITSMMFQHGMNPNLESKTIEGMYPISLVVYWRSDELIDVLLEKGADICLDPETVQLINEGPSYGPLPVASERLREDAARC